MFQEQIKKLTKKLLRMLCNWPLEKKESLLTNWLIKSFKIHYEAVFLIFFNDRLKYSSKRLKLSFFLLLYRFWRIWFDSWRRLRFFLFFGFFLFYLEISFIFLSFFNLLSLSYFMKSPFFDIGMELFFVQKPFVVFTVSTCSLSIFDIFVGRQSAKKLALYSINLVVF